MQAIVANGFIFLSGALGTNTTTIEEQTAEVIRNSCSALLLFTTYSCGLSIAGNGERPLSDTAKWTALSQCAAATLLL